MKKIFLVAAILVFIQKRDFIESYINSPPDYSRGHTEVILYATSWCRYCAKTRKYLDEHNVPFHEYDIEKSEEGKKKYMALRQSGIPVVLIDGEMVRGYNPEKMSQLLGL